MLSKSSARLDFRSDRGTTLVSTLAAMVVGVLVLGGLFTFWLNSTKSADRNQDTSQQEAAALRVLNGVAGDVTSADKLVYASDQKIVVQRRDATGKFVRVRYAMDKTVATNIKVTRTTNKDVPAATANAASFDAANELASFPSTVAPQVIASKAKDLTMFTYFAKTGAALPAGVLDSTAVKTAQRVDISFRADAGRGYVELKSKASLGRPAATGTGNDPTMPGLQCPDPNGSTLALNSENQVVVNWTRVSDADEYLIIKNGSPLGPFPSNAPAYSFVDKSPKPGQTNTYRIQPMAGGDANATCVVRSILVPLTAPNVTGALTNSDADMRLTWPAVTGADSYTVYSRNADPITMASTETWTGTNVGNVTAWTDSPGLGKAKEYYVVANAPGATSPKSNQFPLLNKPKSPDVLANPTDYSVNTVLPGAMDSSTRSFYLRRVQAPANGSAPAGSTVGTLVNTLPYPKATDTVRDALIANPGVENPDQSMLGYDYWYSAQAVNVGPRTSAGGDTTVYSAASPYGTAAKALQFPSDPVTVATGSEANPLGTNKASWSGGRGATGYELWKTYKNVKGTYESAAGTKYWGVGPATSWTDTDPDLNKRGTRHFYMALGINATGYSPGQKVGRTDRAAAYQSPRAVPVSYNFGKQPTDATNITGPQNQPEGNRYEVDWIFENGGWSPDYPQENQPADYAFCAEAAADCKYVTKVNGNVVKVAGPGDKQFAGYASGYGVRDNVTVSACNKGGCSDGSMNVLTYPGPFAINSIDAGAANIYAYQRGFDQANARDWKFSSNEALAPSKNGFASTTFGWSPSEGAGGYVGSRYQQNAYGLYDEKSVNTGLGLSTGRWLANSSVQYRVQVLAYNAWDGNLTRYGNAPRGEKDFYGKQIWFGVVQMPAAQMARVENVRKCYREGNYAVRNSTFGSRLTYSDSTWDPTLTSYQSYGNVGGVSHWATRGTVPNPYVDANGTSSGWNSTTDSKLDKVIRYSNWKLMNAPELGIGHGFVAGPYGNPIASGAGSFGLFQEDLNDAAGSAGSYIVHGLRADSPTAGSDWGNGAGVYWIDVDYRQVQLTDSSDGLCGVTNKPYEWTLVVNGGSLQRRGAPERLVPVGLGYYNAPTGGQYSRATYGNVIGYPEAEQP
jgi:hypothetical protein